MDTKYIQKMSETNQNSLEAAVPRSLFMTAVDWLRSDQPLVLTRRAFVILSMLTLVSVFAMFTYGTLYYFYIPQTILTRQIYFRKSQIFKERPDVDGSVSKVMMEGLQAELLVSESQSFIRAGQTYNVELELDMPDSEVNHVAGTFMVKSFFYDKKNSLITSSSRLVMLKYRSWLLRTMDTLVYAPLYLIGFADQKQIRKVELFKSYRESSYHQTSEISIHLDNPLLQIYDAHITLEAQFSGLKYYMYSWPITAAIVVTGFIWYILFIITGSSWFALSSRKKQLKDQNYQTVLKFATPTPTKTSTIEQSEFEDEMAPKKLYTSLHSAERTNIDVASRTEVTSLGVTPVDSSDMTKHEPTPRRRNHTDEQSST